VDDSLPNKQFSLGCVARLTFRTLALAVLLALIVGWVASYGWQLRIQRLAANGEMLHLLSDRGRLSLEYFNLAAYPRLRPPTQNPWDFWAIRYGGQPGEESQGGKPFPFATVDSANQWLIAAPYWFLTTLAAMAAALSFKRTWRFTTRQLLIATTAVALLLGAVAWSMRG
jgi:hypothetical protein